MKFSDQKRSRALQVIAQCDGSLTLAASRLGVSVPTLSRWKKAALQNTAIAPPCAPAYDHDNDACAKALRSH